MADVRLVKGEDVKVLTNEDLIALLKEQGWKVEGEEEVTEQPKKRGRKAKLDDDSAENN